ncbi:ferredoxin [candidate division KSB1 bacterium]|nr:MAG: ferredoxin [candidate division KSB1 bacterium]
MRVRIDAELCTACELCVDTCPDIFKMGDDVAVVIQADVPVDLEDCAQEAVDSCPSEAIIIS